MSTIQRSSRAIGSHDPAQELYDCACELLLVAQALRSAAAEPGAEAAIAATIGCFSAALEGLAEGVIAMRREAM